MARSAPIAIRVQPETKAALEHAAEDDIRSVSSLVEKIVVEWLREHDYLKQPAQKKRK